MNINQLKQANELFETLTKDSPELALAQLAEIKDLDPEIAKLVTSLIYNNQQSSAYFDLKVSHHYQKIQNKNWQSGDRLGSYILSECIGRGGMSVVFKGTRAVQESQKPVAIKIINLAPHSHEIKSRFLSEQRILANLTHPNIIEFHHGGHTEHDEAFMVMEYLAGALTIDQYVKEHQLNSKQIIQLIIHAADALQHAHNQLIIHRDIKPSNIMVDTNGQPKVLDFGIAKSIDLNKKATDEQTLVALTPSFAAPEQINAQSINVTADVFSLAAVTSSLLTQQLPFPPNRIINNCSKDEQHVEQLLKSHDVDADLRLVLMQAMQFDPQHRYPNMYAFKQDLMAWLSHRPVSARKGRFWYRVSRFAIRRKALFITSIMFGLTVLLAVIGLSWQNQTIKTEITKAQAVKQFMLDAFSVSDPNVSQGVELSTRDLLRLAADKIKLDLGMDEVIKFELLQSMAIAHGRLGYFTEALALLADTADIKPGDEYTTALVAQYAFTAGQLDRVNQLLETTNEGQFEQPDHQMMFKRVRANVLAQAGQYEQALHQHELLKALTSEPREIIKNQSLLAEIHYLKGESERSVEIINQVLAQHPLKQQDVLSMSLNSDLVQYHDRLGNYDQAMRLTQQNINDYQLILGDQHPNLGQALNDLSVFQRFAGEFDAALASAEKSKALYRDRYGDISEGLAQAHSNAGMVHYLRKNTELAIQEFTAAADMLIAIFSADHPEAINAQANLATILNGAGYPEKALPILKRIHQIELSTLGPEHRSTLITQQSLALTLANLGLHTEAIEQATMNAATVRQHYPNRKVFIEGADFVLGRVYFMTGNYPQALTTFNDLLNHWHGSSEYMLANVLQLKAESLVLSQKPQEANLAFQAWIDHLHTTYGETDLNTLTAQLDWAEVLRSQQDHSQALEVVEAVRTSVTNGSLNLPSITSRLESIQDH